MREIARNEGDSKGRSGGYGIMAVTIERALCLLRVFAIIRGTRRAAA